MLKIIPITLILFMLTNIFYSQTKTVPKDVELRMGQNRKSQIPAFQNVWVVYSFKNIEITSRTQAYQFDEVLFNHFKVKVKSCETSETSNGYNTVVIAEGFVTADDLKFMTMQSRGNIEAWRAVYSLAENVTIAEKVQVHIISKDEYESMPENKRKHIQGNPEKYKIVKL
jgi:hypothetical protein